MLTYKEALSQVISLARSFGTEIITLDAADGRILTENISADRDYPPFNRSAMDGYAIHTGDWEAGIRSFKLLQVIYAGQSELAQLTPGTCYKIMTGAPVPYSANAVIRREDAHQIDGIVEFRVEMISPYQNIARQGEDIKSGGVILNGNHKCTPVVISLLASLGKNKIKVEKLPHVALFTTGDEIVDPGSAIAENQIRNSNQYLLKSMFNKWAIKPLVTGHIIDNKEQLHDRLSEVLDFDIIVTCGGVSAGDADYLPEVLRQLGVKKLFHKVAIKPGKPIWCGILPNGGMVFALPGNPFSCMVTFRLFIDAFLSVSFGLGLPKTLTLPFAGMHFRKTNFDEFFPAHISGEPSVLQPIAINGSGDIRLGLHANALAMHPAADTGNIETGTMVTCYPL